VRPEGLEPPAYWFEASRSIQLSYGRTVPSVSVSDHRQLVVRTPQTRGTVQLVDQPQSMLRQERQDRIQPLLQVALRVDQVRKIRRIARHPRIPRDGATRDAKATPGDRQGQ
jgi:hypothetical protein